MVVQGAVELIDGARIERRVDGARREVDNRHFGVGQLAAQGLREAAQTGLGRRVGGKTGKRQAAERRADVDDGRRRLRLEPRQERLGEAHRRFEIGRQHLLDGCPFLLIEQAKSTDAGVVDQHVDAEFARRADRRGDSFRLVEIGAHAGYAGALPGQFGADHGQPLRITAGQQHRGAGLRQLACEFLAEAAAGAGQQDAGLIQLHVDTSPLGSARKISPYS